VRRALVAGLVAGLAVLAGCGGGSGTSYPKHPSAVGPLGRGSDGVWLFRPAGKPKGLVVFFHGQGGPEEATPVNHRPWIDHLVARGNVVVYPRWEIDYERNPLEHAVRGVRIAVDRLDWVEGLPVLAIGYSRGGALALEYAAEAPKTDVPVPNAVMSVFPVPQAEADRQISFATLEPSTRLLLMVGDKDTVVYGLGARVLLRRLETGGFPADQVKLLFARSHGSFVADHFAPLRTSRAARATFWRPADSLLARFQ
jgi:poly(3-hydroxybutyrate) depolymerase